MVESRNELLGWFNEITQLKYSKIEEFGTGSGYCMILNSIYNDIPINKIKLNAKHQYEYISNYKVLQAEFDKHNISNHIPVEKLIKCKFQDNLEFLQWIKKYYDSFASTSHNTQNVNTLGSHSTQNGNNGNNGNKNKSKSIKKTTNLGHKDKELKEMIIQLEREREFYFGKLREIELLVQHKLDGSVESGLQQTLLDIQNILYKTEEGFEQPDF